jgi:streptomycin 6-kinase
MDTFEPNIQNSYGTRGKQWLGKLPKLVNDIATRFGLSKLSPVSNLSYTYVLSGFQGEKPIILKLGLNGDSLKQEAFVLGCFENYGAVKVLGQEDGLLLLERAIPGTSLKSYFPNKDVESIKIASDAMAKLHQAKIPTSHNLPHIRDWLSVLDKEWEIPRHYLQEARQLRHTLLQTSGPNVLLHGDLHHDNILQNGDDWLVIDPKGVIGDKAYEIGAFIRNPMPGLLDLDNAPSIIRYRIAHFAKHLELSENRILDWCFIQAVLAWAWALEDNCPADYFKRLTKILRD